MLGCPQHQAWKKKKTGGTNQVNVRLQNGTLGRYLKEQIRSHVWDVIKEVSIAGLDKGSV